jgi:hypothetical protein
MQKLKRFWKQKPSIIDEPIEDVLSDMNRYGPSSEEYSQLVDHLDRLVRIKHEQKQTRISPDTMVLVAGNLVGILIIVTYEHNHVMVSKAMNYVLRTNAPSALTTK